MRIKTSVSSFVALMLMCILPSAYNGLSGQGTKTHQMFSPGKAWTDTDGVHINAHGGGVIFHNGLYYWFGEHKIAGPEGNSAQIGVGCYSSADLYNWKNEGIAFSVVEDPLSEVTKGSVIERPKVIYNAKTNRFVMWFHLELKGEGYLSARTGLAVSKNINGPYAYVGSVRPNAGQWPLNYTGDQNDVVDDVNKYEWWTPAFNSAVADGLFVKRDFKGGQMSRDMTLFLDDNGKAYQVRSSEENLTIHISELSDDYLSFTHRWIRIFPGGHNEAPAVFKHQGKYYMFTSGCTGWDPNAARLAVADSMLGEWKHLGNPCVGRHADKTFFSQSTFVIPVEGKKGAFIFMGDRWNPRNPIDGTYVWLPVTFKGGLPFLRWRDGWDLSVFEK